MVIKAMAGYKKLSIIGVVLVGFLVGLEWDARAESTNPYRVTVAQNETQSSTGENTAPARESKEPKSKADDEKKPTSIKKKPLKEFQPSEKIEAEQAVDFPYDI